MKRSNDKSNKQLDFLLPPTRILVTLTLVGAVIVLNSWLSDSRFCNAKVRRANALLNPLKMALQYDDVKKKQSTLEDLIL